VHVTRFLLRAREYRYPLDQLVLTKENHKRLRPKDSVKRLNLLPDEHPNMKQGSCALVGNAGGLLAAKLGPAIDEHDMVMRINQGPTQGYELHTGMKTTFRLINKKWASVYASRDQGQAVLIPREKANATLIVTRASKWAFERLAALMRRERPDVRVIFLANGPVSRSRWLLQGFREAAERLGMNYTRGDAPSSGMIGLYLLLEMCSSVSVYGLGQALPETSASQAFDDFKRWAPATEPPPCKSSTLSHKAVHALGYREMSRVNLLLPHHPYPYHYFHNYPDSFQLRAHPHHDFAAETDFMHAMNLAVPEVSFCPPPPPCSIEAATCGG